MVGFEPSWWLLLLDSVANANVDDLFSMIKMQLFLYTILLNLALLFVSMKGHLHMAGFEIR